MNRLYTLEKSYSCFKKLFGNCILSADDFKLNICTFSSFFCALYSPSCMIFPICSRYLRYLELVALTAVFVVVTLDNFHQIILI